MLAPNARLFVSNLLNPAGSLPGQQTVVGRFVGSNASIQAEMLLGATASCRSVALPKLAIRRDPQNGICHRVRIARRNHKSGLAVDDRFRVAADISHDRWKSGLHAPDDGIQKPFSCEARTPMSLAFSKSGISARLDRRTETVVPAHNQDPPVGRHSACNAAKRFNQVEIPLAIRLATMTRARACS
jgi:hypothetical protein